MQRKNTLPKAATAKIVDIMREVCIPFLNCAVELTCGGKAVVSEVTVIIRCIISHARRFFCCLFSKVLMISHAYNKSGLYMKVMFDVLKSALHTYKVQAFLFLSQGL